jgi:uncharacterized membrane protein (DUF373 family)
VAIFSVIAMIAFITALTLIGLAISLFEAFFVQQVEIQSKQDILTFIGDFLVVVIEIELLDTLLLYVRKHTLFPELILMVVLAAVAREVLVTDLTHIEPSLLMAIGAILIAIAGAYYLIRRAAWEARVKGEGDGTELLASRHSLERQPSELKASP